MRAFHALFLFLGVFISLSSVGKPSQSVRLDIPYKTTPEGVLHLDLYYPDSVLSGKYPLVIYTHGGGWVTGSKKGATVGNMAKVVNSLTQKGFCVASVEYRLWSKDGNVSMRDCVIDSKDAIRYLSKNDSSLFVDSERVFAFGDSAGGQIAQMLLLTSPESLSGADELAGYSYKMIAGVSWYGPCDFEKTELFNPDGRENFKDRFGLRILKPDTDPKDKSALYREMSPINYLRKNSPPLLMIQGDKDTTIPIHHAYYMKEKADAVQAPVEIFIVKNAGHNWRQVDDPIEPSAAVIVQRTVGFLCDHLNANVTNSL
ncbi:prolyl oligopeptidase family serine peptidase [Mangrovibacterium sp.]|uniref:prolyl oligopeptidase family serine peptidase n=1 Tax=Mangrovibacterium sp. TaxID=1961364 RepID=UPI003562D690